MPALYRTNYHPTIVNVIPVKVHPVLREENRVPMGGLLGVFRLPRSPRRLSCAIWITEKASGKR